MVTVHALFTITEMERCSDSCRFVKTRGQGHGTGDLARSARSDAGRLLRYRVLSSCVSPSPVVTWELPLMAKYRFHW